MAKRPGVLPKWVTEDYGGYGQAWETAVTQCRNALYAYAAAGDYKFYGDLVRQVTAIPWDDGPYTHKGAQIGHLLGQVAIRELERWGSRVMDSKRTRDSCGAVKQLRQRGHRHPAVCCDLDSAPRGG